MKPHTPLYRILFLCTGNSARSILAEFLLRRIAPATFTVFSAGSSPAPSPHPLALRVLNQQYQINTSTARSKSWEELRDDTFDFVITLCDEAKETCPVWPGQPIIAHWPCPDPSKIDGTEQVKERAFWQVARQIQHRLELLASFPFEKLDALRLEIETQKIGQQNTLSLNQLQTQETIRLKAFHDALAANTNKHLAFILPDGNWIPRHAHITEVGRTEKRFLDCGGKLRHIVFASLQIWVADDTDHRLPAAKLLSILHQGAVLLGEDNPEVQIECQNGSINLFSVSGFEIQSDLIVFTLSNKETACLAMETCILESEEEETCCSNASSCCS